MNILAGGITYAQQTAVIILCIVILVFTAVNAILVVTLQRRNRKLNGRLNPPEQSESGVASDETADEHSEQNPNEHNI